MIEEEEEEEPKKKPPPKPLPFRVVQQWAIDQYNAYFAERDRQKALSEAAKAIESVPPEKIPPPREPEPVEIETPTAQNERWAIAQRHLDAQWNALQEAQKAVDNANRFILESQQISEYADDDDYILLASVL